MRVSYLLSFLCCCRMGCVFLIFLVFCIVVGLGACFLSSNFLCCGRMGCLFLIFLVFCVVVGWGACFLSS